MLIIIGGCSSAWAQPDVNDLLDMSLEQLMLVSVAGSLTASDAAKSPVSVTTVTREQIDMTPARNIYDLIEIYVPGAFWFMQHNGSFAAMRGIAVDGAYKTLLLVNGRLMNQRGQIGAATELENWELSDVEKIEIIRGPGSVTYGPGAIQGVVNIITRNAQTAPGTQTGGKYVSGYNSTSAYASHGIEKENYKAYLYGSWTQTKGIKDPDVYVAAFSAPTADKFIGSDYLGQGPFSSYVPPDYFWDAEDKPQLKFHGEVEFLKEWKLWARYTNSGQSRIRAAVHSNEAAKVPLASEPQYADGRLYNRITMAEQALIALENNHAFNDKLSLKSELSYDSISAARKGSFDLDIDPNIDYYDPTYDVWSFSEDKLFFRSLLNYKLNQKIKMAGGIEYVHEQYGPRWGESAASFIMSDGPTIISGTDSVHYAAGTGQYLAGNDGFSGNMYSALGEINGEFHPKFNLLLSGRVDKHSLGQSESSQRAAIISQWDNIGTFKLIAQKSIRMTNATVMYAEHAAGIESIPEELRTVEFIHTSLPFHDVTANTSLFYNDLDVIGWGGSATVPLGNHKMWGVELDARYDTPKLTVGLNHSYVKQLDFELAPGQTRSYISYSDHYYKGAWRDNITLADTGNDINNWANHSTKFYSIFRPSERVSLLTDMRIFWGYEGAKDMLDMFENGMSTNTNDPAASQAALDKARADDLFGIDFRFDLALKYQLTEQMSVSLFGMNLIDLKNNRRYSYMMHTALAVDEPTVWGCKVDFRF